MTVRRLLCFCRWKEGGPRSFLLGTKIHVHVEGALSLLLLWIKRGEFDASQEH